MSWTEEMKTTVQTMWLDGTPVVQIAEKIEKSKNAVIGIAHRMGLPRHKRSPLSRPRAKKQIIVKINNFGEIVRKTYTSPPKPPPEAAKGIPFMELQSKHCRAIIGASNDPRGLAIYCGLNKHKDTSWCEHHLGLYTNDYRRTR